MPRDFTMDSVRVRSPASQESINEERPISLCSAGPRETDEQGRDLPCLQQTDPAHQHRPGIEMHAGRAEGRRL
jgi:hypothetical protein